MQRKPLLLRSNLFVFHRLLIELHVTYVESTREFERTNHVSDCVHTLGGAVIMQLGHGRTIFEHFQDVNEAFHLGTNSNGWIYYLSRAFDSACRALPSSQERLWSTCIEMWVSLREYSLFLDFSVMKNSRSSDTELNLTYIRLSYLLESQIWHDRKCCRIHVV